MARSNPRERGNKSKPTLGYGRRRAGVGQRGVTLVELLVATVVGLLLTAAALAFATQETRLMDVSQERLQMSMVGRSALSILADDLRRAGAGVGYDESRVFRGLLTGDFNAGGVTWLGAASNTYTRPRPGPNFGISYTVPSQDLGIVYASGSYATIVEESAFSGELCLAPDVTFRPDELVIMREGVGISALSGRLSLRGSSLSAGDCPCVGGCSGFVFTPTSDFTSGPGAATVGYGFGEIQGGLRTVVWFVVTSGGEGELRRADLSEDTCLDRETCGGVVAHFADWLIYQVWRWDEDGLRWEQVAPGGLAGENLRSRLRVDVEIVLRSDGETISRKPFVTSKLQAGVCSPSCDPSSGDNYVRSAYRTSVEILNSGFMSLE